MREIRVLTPPKSDRFIAFELWSITSPDRWAKENRKKGQRESTLVDIERRRCNRWTIREELYKNKELFRLNDPNSIIVIEIYPDGEVSVDNAYVSDDINGHRGFYRYEILKPVKIISNTCFTAETSDGLSQISIHPTSLSVKVQKV